MKIQVMSDLHLEFDRWPTLINGGADTLILAGDICMAHNVAKFMPFFEDVAVKFSDVIYYSGNHEFYHYGFETTSFVLHEELKRISNIHFLDGESKKIGDVTFWGGTLWTDCNRGDPGTIVALKCGLNDYWLISKGITGTLTPQDTAEKHQEYLTSIREFLSETSGKIVMATHHSPSTKSIAKKYGNDYHINGGYHSDLDGLIEGNTNIKLWVHGHTHILWDYMINETRVVCNPAGYPIGRNGYERENAEFDRAKIIEV